MSVIPTPLQKLENLSGHLNANIYCKRDDMTGFAFGGSKTRKLDFLVAEALKEKADVLIGVGGIQSNFCRLTAAAGAVNGLEVQLVLGGERYPDKPTANLLLDEMFGAKINFVKSENWNDWEEKAKELTEELTQKGKRVYYMPIGGSSPTGALGYASAFLEIMEDCKIHFDYIIHATGSAGTQSGLLVGKKLSGSNEKILGVAVTKSTEQLTNEIFDLSERTSRLFGVSVDRKDIFVDDSYIGEKYGAVTEGGKEAVELFAKKEGVVLDYVYSGKAAAGMIDYIRKGIITKKMNVLFIHTGGNVQIFH